MSSHQGLTFPSPRPITEHTRRDGGCTMGAADVLSRVRLLAVSVMVTAWLVTFIQPTLHAWQTSGAFAAWEIFRLPAWVLLGLALVVKYTPLVWNTAEGEEAGLLVRHVWFPWVGFVSIRRLD